MLLPIAKQLLLVQACALCVAAHRDWWIQSLPYCWRNCILTIEDSCHSRKCMCESSASFLPSAVACAASQCEPDTLDLDLFLGPLQPYCNAIDYAIPDQVMNRAYAAAAAAATPTTAFEDGTDSEFAAASEVSMPRPSKTPAPTASHKSQKGVTKSKSKSKSKSRVVATSTQNIVDVNGDGDGDALQIIIPIIAGSSTEPMYTPTITRNATRTTSTTCTLTSITTTNLDVVSEPKSSPTSAETPPAATRPVIGNGTPFENMQAGADEWYIPVPLLCLGAVACLFVRL